MHNVVSCGEYSAVLRDKRSEFRVSRNQFTHMEWKFTMAVCRKYAGLSKKYVHYEKDTFPVNLFLIEFYLIFHSSCFYREILNL